MTRISLVVVGLVMLLMPPATGAETVGPIRASHTLQGTFVDSPRVNVDVMTVDFSDVAHGFLVTRAGTCPGPGCAPALLVTADGGQSWRTVYTGIDFLDLSFVSPRLGFGVDEAGTLLETHDGGRQWTVRRLPARSASRVDAVDAQHVWALAGQLYRTLDGGKSWSGLPFRCGRNETIARVSFVNRDTGFLVCSVMNGPFAVTLYRSDDGGSSWRSVSVVDPMAHALGALDFISPRIGFVTAGFGNLLRTDDGGHTFREVSGTPFENVLAASWFSPGTGYVATHNVLMKTVNRGAQWRQLYPALIPQGPISLTATGAGIGAGISWFPAAILSTRNGSQWQLVNSMPVDAANPAAGVVFTSIGRLVRTSSGTVWDVAHLMDRSTFRVYVLRSRDDGRDWQRVLSVPGGGGFLSFPGLRLGFLVTTTPFRLYVTADGGATWSKRTEPLPIWNAQFVSSTAGWAFGIGQVLLHTNDGGQHWQRVPIHISGLNSDNVFFLNPRDGWITGRLCVPMAPCDPVILRTRDGGTRWTLIRFRGPLDFDGVDWVTPRLGYLLNDSTLYRTKDGGITWRIARH